MILRIILTIIATISLPPLSARELKVESFRQLPNDNTAQLNLVKDLNKDICALVKVKTDLTGCIFDGAIGETLYRGGVYNLYLSPGTRRLGIKCKNHDNYTVVFADISDIKVLKPAVCYSLELTDIDNSKETTISLLEENNRGIKVKKLEFLPSDISARTKDRYDLHGKRCALIKVELPIPSCEFEGNIGSADFHINEYWVYVSPQQKNFVLKCPGYDPLSIKAKALADIESGQTYKLSLSGYDYSLVKFTDKFANAIRWYDKIEAIDYGFFIVKKNNLCGVIDIEGKEIIPCKYDYIYGGDEGYFSVKKGDFGNIIDMQGKELFPWKYESIFYSSDGLFKVGQDVVRGYIDLTGKEIIPCIYYHRGGIQKIGNLIVGSNDDKTIIFDIKNRKYIQDPTSLGIHSWDITPVRDGTPDRYEIIFYIIKTNDKYSFINEEGKKLSPYEYSGISHTSNPACWTDDGTLMVKRNGKWGYVDDSGAEITTPAYDEAVPFVNGYAMVYQRGKGIEIINKDGSPLANFGPDSNIKYYEGDYYPNFYADEDI